VTLLVVGNATTDLFFEVEHVPRPGETLIARNRRIDVGGKGLNQAVAAARAGAQVQFRAAVGHDTEGELIAQRLAQEGFDPAGLVVRDGYTDQSVICVAGSGENAIVSTNEMARSISIADIHEALETLSEWDFLLIQGNLSQATTLKLARVAAGRQTTVLLNAAPVAYSYGSLLPCVDVLVVNDHENAELSRKANTEDGSRSLLAQGVGTVVTTLGARGAHVATELGSNVIPAPRVQVVDTAGAGDVFCGVFAAALTRSEDLLDAARWAIVSASFSVTRRGTSSSFPSRDEMATLRFDPMRLLNQTKG
jgi:ribokinase